MRLITPITGLMAAVGLVLSLGLVTLTGGQPLAADPRR